MIRTTFCLAGLLLAGTASAQPATGPRHSVGADLSFSSDADRTDVLRLGLNFDLRYRDEDDHLGVRLERNTYRPAGGTRVRDERVYLRAAGALEGGWTGRAQVGSDGDTLLGSASINDDSAWRKEFFVERDKVETRQGVTRPILYTFVGAALDVPLARTTQATLLGAVQDFTGSNVRSHVRANLIQVLHERIGLSAQLRTRYFHNSRPREFDYFSPEEHVDLLPVLQFRRYRRNWRYLAAVGWGAQWDKGVGWRSSRYLNARLNSPAHRRRWVVGAEATYTNTPVGNGDTYDYARTSLSLTRVF
jgi:hypothetical protein